MNPEVKAKWIAALRSGKYQQLKGELTNNYQSYCCLGVLCEIAVEAGVAQRTEDQMYGACEEVLPNEVKEWADLRKDDPRIGECSATSLNDSQGKSFNEIADLIEVYL